MTTGRMRRVDEAIRQVIGDAVAADLKDPRVGFVTVTDVKTSPDLRHARVYVSVLGDAGRPSEAEQREASLEGLRSAHGFLQGRLASELRLKSAQAQLPSRVANERTTAVYALPWFTEIR